MDQQEFLRQTESYFEKELSKHKKDVDTLKEVTAELLQKNELDLPKPFPKTQLIVNHYLKNNSGAIDVPAESIIDDETDFSEDQ